ncbi:hypothetical protein Pcinc_020488 [Petrolisthes cinctipes]|uniref:Uncharacterized protein n=1 Tax=Petrolisthes cinctipes TaxID=88211 RepID=A0AAE1KGD7_PETCI|nr:hypothetical protein Pcinc_020488 [Petrolisthes cinctipes]
MSTDPMEKPVVQRSFTSKISPLSDMNYSERLKHLKLFSLQRRRESRTGPKLFNSLPLYLRNMSACSVNVFKRHLDNFLQKIPDTHPLPSYQTWPHYNKLEHHIPLYLRQNRGYSGTSCS